MSTAPPRTHAPQLPATRAGGRLGAFWGQRSGWPLLCPAQSDTTGHTSHPGLRGVHTSAPSSIRAWFQAPAWPGTTSAAAWAQTALRPAVLRGSRPRAASRASTRSTLPSTTGVSRAKAIDAIAPAV